jgi:hypothetical protein
LATINIPKWKISGDWFDVCKCNIPCPCEFAQTPSMVTVMVFWLIILTMAIMVTLNGLNVLALASFEGNIWAGNTKASIAIFFDELADQQQREALQMIFSGKAGGFMAQFAKLIGEHRGVNFAPI